MTLIPVADPGAQNQLMSRSLQEVFAKVIASGNYILGPELEALEIEFARFIGTSFSVGVASGTDAITLTLKGLGVGAGDEVITASHTAVATVAGIELAGATPVLVDIDPRFYTITPLAIRKAITSRTAAVMPVHLYGQSAEMTEIVGLCEQFNLKLVEDVSQAHGATWAGRRLGSIGSAGCFSCYPTKNFSAIGDAGLITTNNAELVKRIRAIRQYGWTERNYSEIPGMNSRLDEVQAAILRVKLSYLDSLNERRQEIAKMYLNGILRTDIVLPEIRENGSHVYHLFVLNVNERDQFREKMLNFGVSTAVHYPRPVHQQPAYSGRLKLPVAGLPVTDELSNRIVSIPIFPEMSNDMVERVIDAVNSSIGV